MFLKKVSNSERKKIATSLLKYKPAIASVPQGVPVFPNLNNSTRLSQLIGPNSWFIFNVLGCGEPQLNKSRDKWKKDPNFKEMENIIKNFKVINDTYERG